MATTEDQYEARTPLTNVQGLQNRFQLDVQASGGIKQRLANKKALP